MSGLYENLGVVDCTNEFDSSNVGGKTAIVTGGGGGIGAAYVRALAKAGATVIIGDLNEKGGQQLVGELSSVHFSHCDVTKWEDQLALFRKAKSESPTGNIDIVVANAGISGADPVFMNEDIENQEWPEEPRLSILSVDIVGVLYTVKLALHRFERQYLQDQHNTSSLILQTSIAAYLCQPGSPQYNAAKFGKRGLMRCLRETSLKHGTRVNSIAPWFVRTGMNEAIAERVTAKGIVWADIEDCAEALMKLVSDGSINGRNLAVVPRAWAKRGYLDLNLDDYEKEALLEEMQQIVLRTSHRLEIMMEAKKAASH